VIQKARAIWGECFGIPRTSGASKRTLRIDAGAKRATTEKADKPPSEAAWKRKRSSAVTAGAQSAPKRTKTEVKEDAERISAPIWGASHQKKTEWLDNKKRFAKALALEKGHLLKTEANHYKIL